MANVVSSAIVNKPPPQAIANLLARRNKIHHLNHQTDETLLKLFDKDPGNSEKTAAHNQVTMPSRNFAMITENSPNNPPATNGAALPQPPQSPRQMQAAQSSSASNNNNLRPGTAGTNGAHSAVPASTNGHDAESVRTSRTSLRTSKSSKKKSKHHAHGPISSGEMDCGTAHKAAHDTEHGRGNDGSLDICIRVEINQHDADGKTESYGLTVPTLTVLS